MIPICTILSTRRITLHFLRYALGYIVYTYLLGVHTNCKVKKYSYKTMLTFWVIYYVHWGMRLHDIWFRLSGIIFSTDIFLHNHVLMFVGIDIIPCRSFFKKENLVLYSTLSLLLIFTAALKAFPLYRYYSFWLVHTHTIHSSYTNTIAFHSFIILRAKVYAFYLT